MMLLNRLDNDESRLWLGWFSSALGAFVVCICGDDGHSRGAYAKHQRLFVHVTHPHTVPGNNINQTTFFVAVPRKRYLQRALSCVIMRSRTAAGVIRKIPELADLTFCFVL